MPRLSTIPSRLAKVGSKLASVSADSWRAGKTTAQRGYGGRWQRYRLQFLQAHPLCAMCEQQGRVTPATVVDHIEPHLGNEALFWEETNHQALCKACHDGTKARQEGRGAGRGWSRRKG